MVFLLSIYAGGRGAGKGGAWRGRPICPAFPAVHYFIMKSRTLNGAQKRGINTAREARVGRSRKVT